MYLKKLRLHNFKSFAGTTEVPFSTGFTGVAGPNGMGKSNISDSILFVLGPPSSKALRADRLTRLFFDGGKTGKPATECEVSLIFDNTDRALAIDMDEVEFTRYVKLAPGNPDGYYSYFYVNGRRSTQGEMDALLSKARLSADGYNIVQQGEINRIIVMSPLERRGLLERLAGIAQYDDDLARAGEKRTSLEANMTQIATLLSEVERHLAELDGQRTQALRFKDLSDQKRRYESALAHMNLSRLKADVSTNEKRLDDISNDITKLKARLEELRTERSRLQSEINGLDAEIAKKGGEEALKIKQEKDKATLDVGSLDMALEKEQENQAALSKEKTSLDKELTDRRKSIEELKKKAEALASDVDAIEKRVQAHTQALSSTGDSKNISQKAAELKKAVFLNEKDQQTKQTAWQEALQSLESKKAEISSAERELALAEEELKNQQAEVKDLEFRVRDASNSRKGSEQNVGALTQELHQLKAKERNLSAHADDLARELLELNRSYSALDAKLKERGAQGGSLALATDFLLTQGNLGKISGIRGKVEDLLSFDSEIATAVSIAGGNRLQSLVVDTDATAQACIELLNREKKGRVTLLPLNKMLPVRPKGKSLVVQKAPGCKGFVLDLVKYDGALESVMSYVFGETLVMDSLENARRAMGGVRLVTLRGELIEASGAMTGGSLGQMGKGKQESMATLRNISESLGNKTAEEALVKSELKTVSERLRQVAEGLARHSGEVSGNANALDDLAKDLQRGKEKLKGTEQRVKELTSRTGQLQKDTAEAEKLSSELNAALEELKVTHSSLEKQYLENLPSALGSKMKKLQEEGEQLGNERVRLHRELEAATTSLASNKEALLARQKEFGELEKRLTAKNSEIKKITSDLAEAKERLAAIEKVVDSQSHASKALASKKDELTKKLTEVSTDEGRSSTKLMTQEGLYADFQIRLQTARKAVEDALSASKDLPEPEADVKGKSLDEIRRKIESLTADITALGAVNTLALEQYDAEKKRMDEFHEEVQRLKDEREGLISLVAQLEDKKRVRLSEVIQGVDQGYRTIYAELSAGGEGELEMEDPSDPLKGGLLIRARPLGKKAARLEQLSGGEKSLASLAFIFALQRYDPSPLYVLDEVDMSLDGINAENIGRMLRRNSTKAQFIVISLRKVTLKWAEHLFGVTMRGDGMSRVVGLRLDDIVDVDERELAKVAQHENMAPRPQQGEAA
jgi:chromosome segregation protein